MTRSVLIFSYYTNMPGACQAEWIDDRMFAFLKKKYAITIVSATCCVRNTRENIRHIKVLALSPHGAGYEYTEIKRRGIGFDNAFIRIFLWCMSSVNQFLSRLHIRSGEGRWSWFVSSFLAGFRVRMIRQSSFIFTTGGPASAHLSGILLAKLFGKKVICELQDPLSGKDIGRNRLSHAGLQFMEKVIIQYADCTLYCTKTAMEYARGKYARYADKIFFVYPGSNKLEEHIGLGSSIQEGTTGTKKINITYLGSLYQTRNLDAIMQAIQELIAEGNQVVDLLEIHLYGNMNPDIRQRIEQFAYPIITIHGLVNRDLALQKGAEADVLLLIQNIDDRSIGTIPFKTYDYLHTGKLILALTYRNEELDEMMLSHGHLVCPANDVQSIKQNLTTLMQDPQKYYQGIKPSNFTPHFAVEEMISLIGPL